MNIQGLIMAKTMTRAQGEAGLLVRQTQPPTARFGDGQSFQR